MAALWACGALLGTLVLCSCGGRTLGDSFNQSNSPVADAVASDAGAPGDNTLKKVTMVVYNSTAGFPTPCDLSQNDTFVFDALTDNFSWDFCAFNLDTGSASPENGSRKLSSYEALAVRNTLSLLKETTMHGCGVADAPLATLDIEAGASTKHYVPYGYACGPTDPGQVDVTNAGNLMGWLTELAYATKIPTSFDGFTLLGPAIFDPPRDTSTGCDETFEDHYHFDTTTRQFTWRHCLASTGSNIYHAYEGTKNLTDDEYASVMLAVSQLEPGNSKGCGEFLPFSSVNFETPTYSETFVTETEACRIEPTYSSGVFTVNIDKLRTLLRQLAY